MNERRQCEFFLVRYVPDSVKNEFVNIGVLLRESLQPENMLVRFTQDWTRVRCIDPEADIEMLEALEAEIRLRLGAPQAGLPSMMKTMEDSFSNLLQITEAKACLAETVVAQMDLLMQLYVEPPRRDAAKRWTGRQAIQRTMRMQFEHAGVWSLMQKRIPVAGYTRPGDPLKIDCAYRPNGIIRMFHAVSLDGDSELAKVLAFSAPALREGVSRVEQATLELTAIVEPIREIRGDEEERVQYRFGVETMEAQDIRVLTVNDLSRVADTARYEMRL